MNAINQLQASLDASIVDLTNQVAEVAANMAKIREIIPLIFLLQEGCKKPQLIIVDW